MKENAGLSTRFWIGAFIATRVMMLLAQPLEGLRGYGDFSHFYDLSTLGRPYLDYWVEFPPLFPWLIHFLNLLSRGREHVFIYLLILLLTLAQIGSLWFFIRLARRFYSAERSSHLRIGMYFVVLSALAYGWWYFDPLAVFFCLWSLDNVFEARDWQAGLSIGLGALTKWFPLLLLPLVWRLRPSRSALRISLTALSLVLAVILGLFALNPVHTRASMESQWQKGSWETVWALLDGNLQTGNFGPDVDRLDSATARQSDRQPARIPTWLTLILIGALGSVFWLRLKDPNWPEAMAFGLLTWSLFFLWSPGWSPQWVLYLIPLILLSCDLRNGVILLTTLILVSLLEWPVFLSRGYFQLLWVPVVLRSIVLALAALTSIEILLGRRTIETEGAV